MLRELENFGTPFHVRRNIAAVKDIRSLCNASRKHFAQFMGVTKDTLAYWENGGSIVRRDEYNAAARHIGWEAWH